MVLPNISLPNKYSLSIWIADFVWNAFEMFMDKCCAYGWMMEILFTHPCISNRNINITGFNGWIHFNVSTTHYIGNASRMNEYVRDVSNWFTIILLWFWPTKCGDPKLECFNNIRIKLSFQFASNSDYCVLHQASVLYWLRLVKTNETSYGNSMKSIKIQSRIKIWQFRFTLSWRVKFTQRHLPTC